MKETTHSPFFEKSILNDIVSGPTRNSMSVYMKHCSPHTAASTVMQANTFLRYPHNQMPHMTQPDKVGMPVFIQNKKCHSLLDLVRGMEVSMSSNPGSHGAAIPSQNESPEPVVTNHMPPSHQKSYDSGNLDIPLKCVDQHLCDNIPISESAQRLSSSPYHCSVGISPKQTIYKCHIVKDSSSNESEQQCNSSIDSGSSADNDCDVSTSSRNKTIPVPQPKKKKSRPSSKKRKRRKNQCAYVKDSVNDHVSQVKNKDSHVSLSKSNKLRCSSISVTLKSTNSVQCETHETTPDIRAHFSFSISPTDSDVDSVDWSDDDDDELPSGFSDSERDMLGSLLGHPMGLLIKTSCTTITRSASAPLLTGDSTLFSINAQWKRSYTCNKPQHQTQRKVRFSTASPVVHPIIAWSFAYQQSRKGPWEEYARDRCRFRTRIRETEEKIGHVLRNEHRQSAYQRLKSAHF